MYNQLLNDIVDLVDLLHITLGVISYQSSEKNTKQSQMMNVVWQEVAASSILALLEIKFF